MFTATLDDPSSSSAPTQFVDDSLVDTPDGDAPPCVVYHVCDRKHLLDKIQNMDTTEHLEIFKIIHKKQPTVNYTINNNGLFINMSELDDSVVQELDGFISFCIENKKKLDEYDQRMQECKLTRLYDTLGANVPDANAPTDATPDARGHKGTQQYTLHALLNNNDACEREWVEMAKQSGEEKTFQQFLDACQSQSERVVKKKTHSKYNLAKKKYARRILSDKKYDGDSVINMLSPEPYDL